MTTLFHPAIGRVNALLKMEKNKEARSSRCYTKGKTKRYKTQAVSNRIDSKIGAPIFKCYNS